MSQTVGTKQVSNLKVPWFHRADNSVYKNALSLRNDNIEDIVQVFSIMGLKGFR